MSKEDVILLAGTLVEHEVAGVWKLIPSLTNIGETGEMSEPKEKTNLANRIKRYGSGLRDAPDKTLQGQYIPKQEIADPHYADYVLQQEFLTRCKNEEEFNMRIKWPDGEVTGFLFKSLGFKFPEGNQEEWKLWEVGGKQNSRPVYSVTVAGSTALSSTPIQLTVAVTPVNLTPVEYGGVKWSSSDVTKATVNATTGLVTRVAAGSVTISAEVRGVTGSLAVTVS